jgi:hypothetical protein
MYKNKIGRLFKQNSFLDKTFHIISLFIPGGSAFATITDNIGSEEGFIFDKKNVNVSKLNGIYNKPKVF